jgi:pyruvate dehydrogenase E2 component (dihydrolipoamide acetyltransferase)
MISEVVMPQMGADMTEGTLLKWLKAEGDEVERGEIIAEIETDKANVEIEAFESGVFRKAIANEGDTIEVGGLIGIIAAVDDDISRYADAASTAASQPDTPPPTPQERAEQGQTPTRADAPSPAPSPAPAPPVAGARVRVSPVARRMADEASIDIRSVVGTGPDGRIVKRDIEAALSGPARGTTPRPVVGTPSTSAPSKMRQAIARRMSQSKRESPHYYLLLDIDMTAALELRTQYNTAIDAADVTAPAGAKVSINDMLVRATALALRKHAEFNATIDDSGTVTQHSRQNICIGIALDDGLIAPAILDAADKTLTQIAVESADLAARAKGGSLRPAEINDGTFTVTNLGAYGIETLIGIIQPPQTAILGVGTVMQQPVVQDGAVAVRDMLKVALSADHRSTDGAQGAQFLTEVQRLLENPVLLVV